MGHRHHMMHNHSSWSGPILGIHLLIGMLIAVVGLSVGLLLRAAATDWTARNYGNRYASAGGWLAFAIVMAIAVGLALHIMRS